VSRRGEQPEPDHYWTRAYNTKERSCSFWHQVDEVLSMGASTALEVGPGSGVVTDWLRRAGVDVTTLDPDTALEPGIVGSVTAIPLDDDSFDVVLCSQVLEHLPFEEAEVALREIRRVCRRGAVVSLPDARPWMGKSYPLYFGLYADQVRDAVPMGKLRKLRAVLGGHLRLRDLAFAMLVPRQWGLGGPILQITRPPVPHGPWQVEPGSAHKYEIGMTGYPIERILGAFERAGLSLSRDYRVPENPWHHFFVLRPR
jgi:SAM-dependent methyltransferase